MKKFNTLFATIALAVAFASPAFATTSSINPTQPAQNAPLLSATIRALALAAYNDITSIFGDLTVSANQFLGSTAGGQVVGVTIPNCPGGVGYVSGGGFICASGSGITNITGDVVATGPGAAAAALQNTTTARNNIGLGPASTPTFGGLTLTGVGNINLNTGSLVAALTGTTLHQANVDGALNRHQLDAFANSAHFSAVRADGTAAAPTALQSADVIGSFNGWGYDGTSYGAAASYQLSTSQIWTPSAHGSVASMWTTLNGTTTPLQRLIINNDGGVQTTNAIDGDQGIDTISAKSFYATTSGTGYGVHATATGTANTGYAGYFSNTASTGWALYGNGKVGSSQSITAGVVALTVSASAFSTDVSLGNYFRVTPTHSTSTTANAPTNPADGQRIVYELDQDSTGSGTVSWNAVFDFGTSGSPTLTTTASKVDLVGFVYSSSISKWLYLGSQLGF